MSLLPQAVTMSPMTQSAGSKLALLIDFDGTVTEKDMGVALLDAYALEDWRRFGTMREEGLIVGRECLASEFGCLPNNREEEMARFVKDVAVVRPGFEELVARCQSDGIPLSIASSGLGFYIRSILAGRGLTDVPVFSSQANFGVGDRVKVEYDDCPEICDSVGACKCYHALKYASMGYKVVMVGDGFSDTCVAAKADYVFACRRLRSHCEAEGIPFFPFNDFHDVMARLPELTSQSS